MVLAIPKKLKYNNLTKSHKHAPKMEKDLAKRLGGVRVKGSGNGDEKGDVRVRNILRVEAKCTTKKSFTVTREMVEKIEAAALSAGEVPAIEVEFLDVRGVSTHRLAIVPTYVLEMICELKRQADAPAIVTDKTKRSSPNTKGRSQLPRISPRSIDVPSGVGPL